MKRYVILLLLVLGILMPTAILAAPVDPDGGAGAGIGGGVPTTQRNHTGYYNCYLPTTGSVCWYPDFYVSAGAQHGIQQTGVPDNKQCYHRIYHRATGQLIVGVWLWGNDYNYNRSYFTFGNPNSTSQAFEHSVTGCTGTVQVYYWH